MVLDMLDPFRRHVLRPRAMRFWASMSTHLKVDSINRGASAVVEPGLEEL